MKSNFLLIIVASGIMLWGCQEKIDLKLDYDGNVLLVVEGSFTNELKIQEIKLSYSTSYFNSEPIPMVSDAEVTITSNDGESYPLFEVDSLPGIYRTATLVAGTVGKTYTLHIINDNTDYEAYETINYIGVMDSVTYDLTYDAFEADLKYYNLYCYAYETPGKGNYYLFNVYKDGKLDNDTLTESAFSDDSYFDGVYLYGISIYSFNECDIIKCVVNDTTIIKMTEFGVPQPIINEIIGLVGDTTLTWRELNQILEDNLTSDEFESYDDDIIESTRTKLPSNIKVDMLSISEQYYDFCMAVLLETDYSGSMFSGPPANVPTNISNGALGYWECSAVTSYEFVLQP